MQRLKKEITKINISKVREQLTGYSGAQDLPQVHIEYCKDASTFLDAYEQHCIRRGLYDMDCLEEQKDGRLGLKSNLLGCLTYGWFFPAFATDVPKSNGQRGVVYINWMSPRWYVHPRQVFRRLYAKQQNAVTKVNIRGIDYPWRGYNVEAEHTAPDANRVRSIIIHECMHASSYLQRGFQVLGADPNYDEAMTDWIGMKIHSLIYPDFPYQTGYGIYDHATKKRVAIAGRRHTVSRGIPAVPDSSRLKSTWLGRLMYDVCAGGSEATLKTYLKAYLKGGNNFHQKFKTCQTQWAQSWDQRCQDGTWAVETDFETWGNWRSP